MYKYRHSPIVTNSHIPNQSRSYSFFFICFTHRLDKLEILRQFPLRSHATKAGVVELVDTRDSKSRFFGSMGSIPIVGIFANIWPLSKGAFFVRANLEFES